MDHRQIDGYILWSFVKICRCAPLRFTPPALLANAIAVLYAAVITSVLGERIAFREVEIAIRTGDHPLGAR